jgi:hypothetical protein
MKGRRNDEDALAQARRTQDAGAAPLVSESGETIGTPVNEMSMSAGQVPGGLAAGQIPNMANLGAIGAAIQQAMATGNFQVVQAEAQQMQQQAMGMREDMMAVYAKHGVDMTGGGQNAQVDDPQQLQQDLLEVMKKHGMDPSGGGMAWFGMTQAPQVPEDTGSSMKVEPGTPGEPEAH